MECQNLIPLFRYCDGFMRNRLPYTRYFMKNDGTLISKIGKILNEDVYNSIKNNFCLIKGK